MGFNTKRDASQAARSLYQAISQTRVNPGPGGVRLRQKPITRVSCTPSKLSHAVADNSRNRGQSASAQSNQRCEKNPCVSGNASPDDGRGSGSQISCFSTSKGLPANRSTPRAAASSGNSDNITTWLFDSPIIGVNTPNTRPLAARAAGPAEVSRSLATSLAARGAVASTWCWKIRMARSPVTVSDHCTTRRSGCRGLTSWPCGAT